MIVPEYWAEAREQVRHPRDLSTLRGSFGVRVDTKVSKELTVPAAVGLNLLYATTGDTGDTASSTATPERSSS